jgi:hypothetical protein
MRGELTQCLGRRSGTGCDSRQLIARALAGLGGRGIRHGEFAVTYALMDPPRPPFVFPPWSFVGPNRSTRRPAPVSEALAELAAACGLRRGGRLSTGCARCGPGESFSDMILRLTAESG